MYNFRPSKSFTVPHKFDQILTHFSGRHFPILGAQNRYLFTYIPCFEHLVCDRAHQKGSKTDQNVPKVVIFDVFGGGWRVGPGMGQILMPKPVQSQIPPQPGSKARDQKPSKKWHFGLILDEEGRVMVGGLSNWGVILMPISAQPQFGTCQTPPRTSKMTEFWPNLEVFGGVWRPGPGMGQILMPKPVQSQIPPQPGSKARDQKPSKMSHFCSFLRIFDTFWHFFARG